MKNMRQRENFEELRRRMVKTQIKMRGVKDPRVLQAMLKVPRHLFVPEEYRNHAYNDYPLPIGYGQTISQPYIVAAMTELLDLKGDEKVLEIGTGSGYQTALLAELAGEVYTVERIPQLLERAKQVLSSLGYTNIYFKLADGTLGWPENAPFDRIMVTAAAPDLPQPLIDQLAEGGIMVIPVGSRYLQTLKVVVKTGDKLRIKRVMECTFVPLIGEYGY